MEHVVVTLVFMAMFAYIGGLLVWLHGKLPARLRARMDRWFS